MCVPYIFSCSNFLKTRKTSRSNKKFMEMYILENIILKA